MKSTLFTTLLLLCTFFYAKAFIPLSVSTGFNADVIANGVGTALVTTSSDVDGANYCYVSNGWQQTAASTPITTGLPASGIVNSAVTPGLTYQLGNYSANNDLRIPTNTSGTLNFATPYYSAQTVYILAVTGSGTSTMDVQINFTDATSQIQTGILVADWYGGASVAITGFQRVNRTNNLLDNATNGPNMYQYSVAILAANQTKQISSIQFTRTSATSTTPTLNIFAVSIAETASCPAPSAPTATSITATTASLNWTQAGSASNWQIKYGAPGFNPATAGTSVFTTTKPYTLNPPLTSSTAYQYYVRTICGPADTSAWSVVTSFTTLCNAPSLLSKKDSFRCGTGPVTLEGTSSTGGTTTWYANATGGSPLGTGNVFTTPSISATTTYYVAAAGGSGGFTTYNAAMPATIQNNPFITTLVGWGVRFTVTQACFIDSVGVYPIGTGTMAVIIWDAATQAVVYTGPTSQSITGTGTTKSMINVGSPSLPPGNYLMGIASYTGLTNLRNEGFNAVAYPFTCPALSVTAGAQGFASTTANVYYFCYDWRVRVGSACESPRQAVVATVRPVPVVNIGNDTTICPGVSYTMNATTAGATYAWNTGATTPTLTVNAAGTYSVLVTLNGCGGSDARVITPGVVPVNNLPATTDLCSGETATLNAGNTGSSFVWTPGGATTQTINVTTGGNRSVVVKSVDGCKITSNTNVIIRPLPVASLGNDTSICEGDMIVLNAGNPGYAYLWNTGATTQTINASDSGTYAVTITTPYNCKTTEDKHIAFLPSPRTEGFNFIPAFYEQLGKVKFSPLNPTNVTSYEWDFGDGSPHSVQVNPEHIYAGSGQYIVVLKVFNGCGNFSISLPINVNLTTGIVTLSKDEVNVSIYPNPSNSVVTIDNNSPDIKMQNVMVFNTLGAMVYDRKADNDKHHKFNVEQFASGIYSVRILTDKGFVIRKFEVIK
jgi:hypothetical protein